ncbi:hypothetical protein PRUPE_2G036700 [Prunus persica]|uniref:Uncharacterized protein n=1 Tax=Prunus persica TaxID=3760 RepID=A0A251QAK7_PRUPE|nr:hypothetical protein PRUPE_2G036700 [Prunus persica]
MKPFDNRTLTTEHLGISLFSILRPRTTGYLAIIPDDHPILFTKRSIACISFFSETIIDSGFFLKAERKSSSDQPHVLRTSRLLFNTNLFLPHNAHRAFTEVDFSRLNPISLTSPTS